jgi:hypothetical protein
VTFQLLAVFCLLLSRGRDYIAHDTTVLVGWLVAVVH